MICARCGMNVSENSQYCQYCGTKVGGAGGIVPSVKKYLGKLKIRMSGSAKRTVFREGCRNGGRFCARFCGGEFPL